MSVTNLLEEQVAIQPDGVAVFYEDDAISYTELHSQSITLYESLYSNYNICPGDRVAYLGLNHPNMLILFFACARLGGIFTPFNGRLARDEYTFLLENASPKVCFFDEHFADMVGMIAFESFASVDDLKFEGMVEQERVQVPLPIVAPDDPLLLVYTSGTTGKPKGVVLSNRAVDTTIANSQDLYGFKPGQNAQVTLPLFHVGGLCILLLPARLHGASIYLHTKFDPQLTLGEIENAKITTSIFVPAQLDAMMSLPDWNQCNFYSMSHVTLGSSHIPIWQIQKFHERGVPVSQVYGATETGPTAIAQRIEDAYSTEGSVGKAAKHCDIEVRSPDRTPLPNYQWGEIWVKGHNILTSYWNEPEETAKVLVGGWYNTGDVGYKDEGENYWVVDRSKDIIISGGENIYPAEVEAAIIQHPNVAVVAVVGKCDPRWGETPVAAVELMNVATLTVEELNTFLEDKLARYKQPKELMIIDALPRNALGKIEKSVIRDMVS